MKPRFLLDEHINRAIQRQLRRYDPTIEVLAIGDPGAPETGMLDPSCAPGLDRAEWLHFGHGKSEHDARAFGKSLCRRSAHSWPILGSSWC